MVNPEMELLTRAIERLETLQTVRGYQEYNGWLVEENPGDTDRTRMPDDSSLSPITNDELIVLLHRTIGAQLDILRHGLARAESKIATGGIVRHVWSFERDALALARAVLGENL